MSVESSLNRILCYGDSNTWGENPQTNQRYSIDERWPGVLQTLLGNGYQVIEEGLPGRTTDAVGNLLGDDDKDGLVQLAPIVSSYLPLSTIVLYLGANDLKERFKRTAADIADGIGRLLTQINITCSEYEFALPQIILLSPPVINEAEVKPPYRMSGASAKSQQFAQYYAEVAEKYNCGFIDLAKVIEPSHIDGIHLEVDAHRKIAELVKTAVVGSES